MNLLKLTLRPTIYYIHIHSFSVILPLLCLIHAHLSLNNIVSFHVAPNLEIIQEPCSNKTYSKRYRVAPGISRLVVTSLVEAATLGTNAEPGVVKSFPGMYCLTLFHIVSGRLISEDLR